MSKGEEHSKLHSKRENHSKAFKLNVIVLV